MRSPLQSAVALCLAAVVLASVPSLAATGDHRWTNGLPWGRAAAVDGMGNTTTFGVFFGTADFGGGPMTAQNFLTGDVFLAQYDGQGNHRWSQQFSPVGGNGLFNFIIASSPNGNIYVGGLQAGGSLDLGGGALSGPGNSGVLASFDVDGQHRWSFNIGQGVPLDLVVTDTRVVGVGEVDDGVGVDLGGGTLTTAGQEDGLVFELDANGVHQWSQIFGDADRQSATAVCLTPTGDVVLAGGAFGSIDLGGGALNASGIDLYLAQLSSTGSHQWSQLLGGTVNSGATSRHDLDLAAGPSGQISLAGGFRTDIDLGGGSRAATGAEDVFVAAYNSAGVFQWDGVFGNTGSDEATNLDQDNAGNVLITGHFVNTVDFGGGVLTGHPTAWNHFVTVLDATGSHVFSETYGNGSECHGRFDLSNNIVVTGSGSSSDFGGGAVGMQEYMVKLEGTANSPAGTDVPVVPEDATTGSSPITMTFDDISTEGVTTLVSSSTGPPPPGGLTFGAMSTYYDLSTTASFTGNIEVCFRYDEAQIPGDENSLTLQHYDAGVPGWVDITTSLDTANNLLCGVTSSLSPFAVAAPEGVTGIPTSRQAVALGNHPNPFNPMTTIWFDVPRPGPVEIVIYDASGRRVRDLSRRLPGAGRHELRWNGMDVEGKPVASGVYFVHLRGQDYQGTHKLALIR